MLCRRPRTALPPYAVHGGSADRAAAPAPEGRRTPRPVHLPNERTTAMSKNNHSYNRRRVLKAGATLATAGILPPFFARHAFAADQAPIGTYPAGVQGKDVFIGVAVPRTGTYAEQGEDELKGWQLAVEHINSGHELIRKISPKTKKGVQGKELKLVVADSAAKPNDAVQAEQRFITENKVILMTGSTSSAVAVAMNKLAQREKVLYVTGISGSN